MSERLTIFLEQLSKADTVGALQGAVVQSRDIFGVEHVVFHATAPDKPQWSAVTYDSDWVDTYVTQNFQAIDPVVQGCMGGFMPLDWKRLDWSRKQARTLMAEGVAHGVGNQGYSIPVRGPNGQFAVFTVNDTARDDAWATFTAAARNEMLLAAHYINERVIELAGDGGQLPHQALSPRESDSLRFLAKGLSRGQVADRLGISENTLRVYIDSARHKMGALNLTNAVAVALSRGIISI